MLTQGAPTECESSGIPFVFYNGSCADSCPNSYIVASRINWAPYFTYIIDCVRNGKAIDVDWTGNFNTGSVEMTQINDVVAAPGTGEKLAEVEELYEPIPY